MTQGVVYDRIYDEKGKDYYLDMQHYYNNYYIKYNHYYVPVTDEATKAETNCKPQYAGEQIVYQGSEYIGTYTKNRQTGVGYWYTPYYTLYSCYGNYGKTPIISS